MSELHIGNRVIYNFKYKGIVRYIGPVSLSTGILYGVELDTADGKINGTFNGIKYFSCDENFGVFARQSQLVPAEDDNNALPANLNNEHINQTVSKVVQTPVVEITDSSKQLPQTEKRKQSIIPSLISKVNDKENQSVTPLITAPKQAGIPQIRRYTMAPRTVVTDRVKPETQPFLPKKQSDNKQETLHNPTIITHSTKSLEIALEQKNKEIDDLKEQLDSIKILKRKDREKLIELEKSKNLVESEISKLMEINKKIKEEKDSIIREYDSYRDSMKSVEEDIEMVTINKEIAEEKLEQLHLDYKNLKELCDKITEENKALRANCEGSPDQIDFFDQSATVDKYKRAVVEMTSFISTLKATNQDQNNELTILRELQAFQESELEKLHGVGIKYESDLKEMKDLVDSTADAEIMLDNLTFKNDSLEAELKKNKKRLLQLDELVDKQTTDMDGQRLEIKKLLEEIDCMNGIIFSLEERLMLNREKEEDISKTKEVLQDEIRQLRVQVAAFQSEMKLKDAALLKSNEDSRRFSIISYAKENSARDGVVREIEDKLTKIELGEKVRLVNLLFRYLPCSFGNDSGENVIICFVLLVDRLLHKVAMTLQYIGQRKRSPLRCERIDKKSESSSICGKIEFLLVIWKSILDQVKINIDTCDPINLHQTSLLYDQILQHESNIDFLIDLMKKENLYVNRDFSGIVTSIEFFKHFNHDNFSFRLADCNGVMKGFITVIYKGLECLNHDFAWLDELMISNTVTNSQFQTVIDALKNLSISLQSKAKGSLSFLQQYQPIEFNVTLSTSMDEVVVYLTTLVETICDFTLEFNDEKILPEEALVKLMEKFVDHKTKIVSLVDKDIIGLFSMMSHMAGTIIDSFKNGMYDTNNKKIHTETTIDRCAAIYQERLTQLASLPSQIQIKDEKIQCFGKELDVKIKKLTEMDLKVHYFKKKLEATVVSKNQEIERLNAELATSKSAPILKPKVNQADKFSQVEPEISKRTEKSINQDQCINLSPAADIGDTSYYLLETNKLAQVCKSLTQQLNSCKALQSKQCLSKMKSINIPKLCLDLPRKSIVERTGTLSREVCKTLSSIKIPDLSTKTQSGAFSKRSIEISLLRSELNRLKAEAVVLNDSSQFKAFTGSSNGIFGRICFGNHPVKDVQEKMIHVNMTSLMKLEEMFCF